MWKVKAITFSVMAAGSLVALAYLLGKKCAEKKSIYTYDEDEIEAEYEILKENYDQ